MEAYKAQFIEFMVRAGVLRFGEFKTKSGRLSPYFINTGNYRTGAQLAKLGEYYAECIMNATKGEFDVMFGPAYKGIPLAVAAASSLYSKFGVDRPYCFDRKEVKDHGEGGVFVGSPLADGNRVLIVEDVITAGTAVRETLPKLLSAAKVEVKDMIISVNRMEVGPSGKTAIDDIKEEFGITVHSIVTVRDIIEHMHGREIDGEVLLTDEIREKMEAYMKQYCL